MKKPTVSSLKKKVDQVFSLYVRQVGAKNGYNTCFTCGVRKPWKELQCGHYVRRSYNSLRYSLWNTAPQCVGCNMFKQGAADEFALALLKKHGDGILLWLNKEKQKYKQFTVKELEELRDFYKKKIEELACG